MSARSSLQGNRSRAASPAPSLVRAEELHIEHVELPARRASVEARHGPAPVEGMQPVHPGQHVPRGSRIVRDKTSGQHYMQPPEGAKGFSLSRAKNAPRLAARDWHGPTVGLAHHFASPSKPSSVAGDAQGRASRESARTAAPMDAQMGQLVEQLRTIVRDEVQSANRGHAAHVERVADAAAEQAERLAQIEAAGGTLAPPAPDSDSTSVGKEKDALRYDDKGSNPQDVAERAITGDEEDDDEDQDFEFPNRLAKLRWHMREYLAEFLGTAILVLVGNGVNIQVTVSALLNPDSPKGNYLSISFGWGVAVMLGVYASGGISGGLLNPSLTLALAVWRGFPWKKVPGYILAQMLGGTAGALLCYGLYAVPIRLVDPNQTETTAALFTTYPAEFLRTGSAQLFSFYNEVLATALLLIIVVAIGDSNNTPPVEGMAPVILMWLVWALGATLGWQTAYAVNPARDFGPRIALSIVGYRGLWSFGNYYALWTPLLATAVGAQVGCFIYDLLVYTGDESPLNSPRLTFGKFGNVRFKPKSKNKLPAAIDK